MSRWALYLDLIRWNRPAGWLLLLWPSLSALWVASEGAPQPELVVIFVLGTILMRSAGCCLNDVADRDFDRHVKRTAQRPVTRGALGVREALGVGAVLALCAFSLVCLINVATVIWSVLALFVTMIYPYAKRYVSMPQAVLGIAFSFGIPMAFAAVLGNAHPDAGWTDVVPLQAWELLLGNLAWVLAYDTEYAMVDRDDDEKIGMKTSARTLGEWDVAFVMLCYCVFLGSWYWLLRPMALSWAWDACMLLALLQALGHFVLIRSRTREGCFLAFRLNHWLGATVFIGIVLGVALK
jgi:4-hydroxybenzoate polyprenyltransferase